MMMMMMILVEGERRRGGRRNIRQRSGLINSTAMTTRIVDIAIHRGIE